MLKHAEKIAPQVLTDAQLESVSGGHTLSEIFAPAKQGYATGSSIGGTAGGIVGGAVGAVYGFYLAKSATSTCLAGAGPRRAASFDDLGGPAEEWPRHGETERLSWSSG